VCLSRSSGHAAWRGAAIDSPPLSRSRPNNGRVTRPRERRKPLPVVGTLNTCVVCVGPSVGPLVLPNESAFVRESIGKTYRGDVDDPGDRGLTLGPELTVRSSFPPPRASSARHLAHATPRHHVEHPAG
jgi:hypothetical protein